MLYIILLVLSTVIIGYILLVLCWSKNDDNRNTSIESFIDEDNDDVPVDLCSATTNKYASKYTVPGKQVLILYGTEYGFGEEISRKLFDVLSDNSSDIQPRVLNAKNYELIDFKQEEVLLCIFSTTGDGVPPTDTRHFINFISSYSSSHLYYSVLALGDSNYPHFCKTGKLLDSILSSHKANCIHSRVDIDQEDWLTINSWIEGIRHALLSLDLTIKLDYLDLTEQGENEENIYSRTHPYIATMVLKRPLTEITDPNDKETVHCEFDLTGLEYISGDALGIYPFNNPDEVQDTINILCFDNDVLVNIPVHAYNPKPTGTSISLFDALLGYYDLKSVRGDLVKVICDSVTNITEKKKGEKLLKDGLNKNNITLTRYLSDHEVIDVFMDFPSHSCPPQVILNNLRPLQPRYYSIASSPCMGLSKVSICAAVIRYTLHEIQRTGICTTYLQDRLTTGGQVPVFISQNPDFRLPKDSSIPIIMIGPGTGIAPFRSFIQERDTGSKNLLYFGCRHSNKDYLYKDELESWSKDGKIILRVAFSRDQSEKIYVQDLIKHDSKIIWKIIKEGGHVYICGDAKNMASDVHKILLNVIMTMSSCSQEDAEKYMNKMEEEERYQRDVWVT